MPTSTPTATSTPSPTTTPTATSTPTVTATPNPSRAFQAVAYQIDIGHSGATSSPTLNPPLSQRWSTDLGQPISYPLIAQGKVFVTTPSDGPGYASRLYALNAMTGQIAWGPIEIPNTLSRANAAYDDGRLFVVFGVPDVRAFDAGTGDSLWSIRIPDKFVESAPVAGQGVVYVDGSYPQGMYALDARDGSLLWIGGRGEAGPPSLSSDAVFASSSGGCTVFRLNRWSGVSDWTNSGDCIAHDGSTTVVSNERLFVRAVPGAMNSILDARNGTRIGWFDAELAPAVTGDVVYSVGAGRINARSIDGQSRLWDFAGDGKLIAAPIIVNDIVYAASADGNLYGLDVNTGRLVWTTNLGAFILDPHENQLSRPLSGMSAGEGLLVVPAGNKVFAFAPALGETAR